jgi:hypothetical protein
MSYKCYIINLYSLFKKNKSRIYEYDIDTTHKPTHHISCDPNTRQIYCITAT